MPSWIESGDPEYGEAQMMSCEYFYIPANIAEKVEDLKPDYDGVGERTTAYRNIYQVLDLLRMSKNMTLPQGEESE